MLRNKYIQVLGGILSSDVVMFTLFSVFSSRELCVCCNSYLALKSKFGYREMA